MEVTKTLEERGGRYGTFEGNSMISQALKEVMRNTEGWSRLTASQKEALEMDAHKTARILNGDPNYADSWHDKAGYATLVVQQLTEGTTPGSTFRPSSGGGANAVPEKAAPSSPAPSAPVAPPVMAPPVSAPPLPTMPKPQT